MTDNSPARSQAPNLIGSASVDLDSIPLGGEETLIGLVMGDPKAIGEKANEEVGRPSPLDA